MRIYNLWALKTPTVETATQQAVSQKTLIDFYKSLRMVCTIALKRPPAQAIALKKMMSMRGVRRQMLPGYLNEFLRRERNGNDKFDAILEEIGSVYQV